MKRLLRVLPLLMLALLFLAGTEVFAQGRAGRRAKQAEMKAKSREISKFTTKGRGGRSRMFVSVGGFLGMANYFGDLAPRTGRASTAFSQTRTYLGGFYQRRFTSNISVRGHLGWARLRGDDQAAPYDKVDVGAGRYKRGLSFRNNVFELGVSGIIDILPTDRGYLRRNFFNGYGLLGLNILYHDPKGFVPTGYGLQNEGKWVALQPLGTEGQGTEGYAKKYSRIQPAIMVGGGVRYRLNDKLDIGLEIAWRFLFTDYLDDVSTNFMKDADAIAADKDRNWWAMSNKSGQEFSSTGDDRRLTRIDNFADGASVSFEPLPGRANEDPSQKELRRIRGYSVIDDIDQSGNPYVKASSPRGNNDNDGYTVTTLTATYILEYRARVPKFR